MDKLINTALLNFAIAMGVVIGGTLFGSLTTMVSGNPPIHTVNDLALSLKIWGLVAALGGTFDTIKLIETGFLSGEIALIYKQFFLFFSAFLGANAGYYLITSLFKGG